MHCPTRLSADPRIDSQPIQIPPTAGVHIGPQPPAPAVLEGRTEKLLGHPWGGCHESALGTGDTPAPPAAPPHRLQRLFSRSQPTRSPIGKFQQITRVSHADQSNPLEKLWNYRTVPDARPPRVGASFWSIPVPTHRKPFQTVFSIPMVHSKHLVGCSFHSPITATPARWFTSFSRRRIPTRRR